MEGRRGLSICAYTHRFGPVQLGGGGGGFGFEGKDMILGRFGGQKRCEIFCAQSTGILEQGALVCRMQNGYVFDWRLSWLAWYSWKRNPRARGAGA